jgi:hypothetical protein
MDSVNTSNTPAPRLPVALDVSYRRSYGRRDEVAVLKNISLSGAFIEVDQEGELLPNDKLLIAVVVSHRVRKIPAYVVWKNSAGCGIKFKHLNNRDQQIVDDLMYFIESSKHGQRTVLDSIFKKVA